MDVCMGMCVDSILPLALYNEGSEFEFLRRWEHAVASYTSAVSVARMRFGEGDQRLAVLESALCSVQQKVRQQAMEREVEEERDGYGAAMSVENLVGRQWGNSITIYSAPPSRHAHSVNASIEPLLLLRAS